MQSFLVIFGVVDKGQVTWLDHMDFIDSGNNKIRVT